MSRSIFPVRKTPEELLAYWEDAYTPQVIRSRREFPSGKTTETVVINIEDEIEGIGVERAEALGKALLKGVAMAKCPRQEARAPWSRDD